MNDFSSPTADRKIFVRHTVLFLGGGGCASGMSQPPVLCIPGFRLFFLTSSVPLALFRLPLGGGGGRPISLRRADVFPVVASLRRERGDDRKYVCASQAFAGYSPISPASTAKYSVSIWNQKCHFRKGTNFGSQTLAGKSKWNQKYEIFLS